jgi:high-affinity iron transporter
MLQSLRLHDPTRRVMLWCLAAAVAAVLVLQAVDGGVADPTAPGEHLSHGAVILDSSLLVFREGLETILVLAAVTAGLRGANHAYQRPVAAGATLALGASVATWFLAVAVIGALGGPGLDVQAATGLLAVVVLLVVMNWFFHKVYWTGWISHHTRRRGRLLAGGDGARLVLGLGLLGFTSVYREGFEIVLFLQNLRLGYGSLVVLQGVAIGLALTAAVGLLTFAAHRRLPYKRMLVLTGVTIGIVLVVMVGESVQELQLAGWLSTTSVGIPIPSWMGLWLAVFPTVEGLVAQAVAVAVVVGSYVVAEELRVRRPRRRGLAPAQRPGAPPSVTVASPDPS